MYCPKCDTEYVEGVAICADCGGQLIANPPEVEEMTKKPVKGPMGEVEFSEVLTAFNAGDIALIKSILDGESIDYYFHGEFFNLARPLVDPVRLMVRKDQANSAKEILRDLELEFSLNADVEEWKDE
jgi:hypothetical protein